MARITTVQAAHSYGVLDPHVVERRDTKFVGGSLSDGDNIILLPQGGYTDRGGSTDFGRVRRTLSALPIDGTILSLPNGGSESDLLANRPVTTSAVSTTRFVLAELDFGTPTLLHMLDIGLVSIATTAAENALIAESWNGAAWVTFGQPLKLTLTAHSRRFASGAPGHPGVTATKFRIAVDATTAAGAMTFSFLRAWAESGTLSDAVLRRYAPENGSPHQLVVTAGNIDVYEQGTWRAAVWLPLATSANLRTIKFEAKFDTVLAFHRDMPPRRLERLGASDEWASDNIAFTNMPLVDYGGVYANGVDEKQRVQLFSISTGEDFDLTCEGQTTTAITVGASGPATAASIAAALEALPNVVAGLTVTAVNSSTFDVVFSGGVNSGREWLQMAGTALNSDGAVSVRTLVQGKAPGEAIMSNARGWPAVGRFAQQRLIMAGLRSRPNTMIASVTGSPYDLNTALELATAAFSYDVDGVEQILDIVVGRTPIFLGEAQVAWLKGDTLSAEEAPAFGVSDAPGIKAAVGTVSSDNATFYVQEGGRTLRQLTYTELEQNFLAENASVLSAFLIRDPIDITRRRATETIDADLIVMANADGSATALTTMRAQEVSGFAPWSTDGSFLSFMADHDNDLWCLARRLTDSVPTVRMERMDPDELLDEAVELTLGPPGAALSGLARFNGRVVWAIGDGNVLGPFTVSGGAIADIGRVVTNVRVGTWPRPSATDPEVSLTEETKQRQPRWKRVNRAEISVVSTTSLAIAANGAEPVNVPLRSAEDTITDTPPLDAPVTGKATAEGMHGFTRTGQLTVTQVFPGRLTVRSVTKDVVA